MAREISNTDDVINSREIIARIDELERDREIAEDPDDPAPGYFTADEAEELRILKGVAEEGEGQPDWNHGAILIRESYFADYIKDYVEDVALGAFAREVAQQIRIRESYFADYIKDYVEDVALGASAREVAQQIRAADWFQHVDWDAVADGYRSDYLEIDFDGVTYLISD